MYDVAIVGAGPSGCVAAKALLQGGMSVALLDAQPAGRPRICGGGVLTRALNLLLPDAQPALQRQCTTLEVCFHSPKMSFTSRRERAFVSMVSRAELDARLVDGVKALGAEVRQGQALTGLTPSADHVQLETSQDSLSARMVIAADGVNSLTAQRAGFAALPRLGLGMTLELQLPPAQLERHARAARFDFDIVPNGYGWVFPRRDSVSVGVIASQITASDLRAAVLKYLRLLDLGATVDLTTVPMAQVPLEPRPGPLARGRVLCVGEAAGFADPLTGEGLYFAAVSGKAAAQAVLAGKLEPEAVARSYQSELEAKILPELRLGLSGARLFYGYPRLRNMLFRFAGQSVVDVITEIALGDASYVGYLGHSAASLSVPQLFRKIISTEEEARRS